MKPPTIESYRFGHIVIDGEPYTHDVIVLPDRVEGNWWRDKGHRLKPGDLDLIFDAAPEVLVIGTGASGRMRVSKAARAALEEAGVAVEIHPTETACQVYGKLRAERVVAAALHLTC